MLGKNKGSDTILRTKVRLLFEDFLTDHEISYFVGGSERFGWTDTFSDIDIFCLYEFEHGASELQLLLRNHGISAPDTGDPGYPLNSSQLTVMGIIHLNVFQNRASYERLRKEHDMLADTIDKNKRIIILANEMKKYGMRGSSIYQALLNLAR